MSTESERAHSSSDAVDVSNVQMSETLADHPLSGHSQELEAKPDGDEQQGCVVTEEAGASAGDLVMEKRNGISDLAKETESVNGGLDLGTGTQNVDVEKDEIVKNAPVDNEDVLMVDGEKDSDGIQTELRVEKEVEPDMVYSHGADLSDVKGSEVKLGSENLGDDGKPDGSGKQGTQFENVDTEWFGSLEPHEGTDESVDDDDDDDDDVDDAPLTPKLKFSDSDLVWAKVRSHPWWPGQVFDASAATNEAKKYFKKGSILVTYFGDCSFAWNDASRIKPFREHFSQMAKQSTLPKFLDAIDFALEEVSRRIEFGLACSCIPEEVYQNIKIQNIINPGILEESSRIQGGDKVSSAIFFEPVNLVEYVKGLACYPIYDASNELQFVSHRAQLLAFNRWKGYSDLPEFDTLQGSVESAAKVSPAEEKISLFEVEVPVPEPKKTEKVYTKKRKTEDQDDCEHDAVFEYKDATVVKKKEKKDATVLKKKEKTLAELIAEKRLRKTKGKISHEDSGLKPDYEKKRKVVSPKVPKSTKKIKANLETEAPVSPQSDGKYDFSAGDKITPEKTKKSFGIGASILRVANQMHGSTPTELKPCSNSTSKMAAKNNGSGKSVKHKPKAEASSGREISPSPNEEPSSHQSPSITKIQNGKPKASSTDQLHSKEVEQVKKKTPCTNIVEVSEPEDLKDSSKEHKVNEDRKEAANIVGEITIKDTNLTEETVTGSDLKEQPGNNNHSGGSASCCKEDSNAE